MSHDVPLDELRRAVAMEKALRDKPLLTYAPHPKQREFHAAGARYSERMLSAGNREGKSFAGAAEDAIHATGLYPEWWEGRRWERPTRGWVCGISAEQARDTIQRLFYGPPEAPGTGMLPSERILKVTWSKGLTGFLDTMLVRHVSGGVSYVGFKSYEQGRLKFQGDSLDWIHADEEAPLDIYTEMQARLVDRDGMLFTTFTPLLGHTDLVDYFFPAPSEPFRHLVRMEIEDALHIPAERRAEIISKYPLHEREARVRGIPILGSGRVYPVHSELIECDPFTIPAFWKRIAGVDFGWDHPTAIVWLALNRDSGTVYVTDEYRQSEETPVVHAAAIRTRIPWIPVAWPHDGYQHDSSGISLALQYGEHGVRVLPEHAKFPSGSNGVEEGLMQILDAMKTGRLKIFRSCPKLLAEIRMYHRKEGKVVKKGDDLCDALRYAWMMLRYARPEPTEERFPETVGGDYEPLARH